MELTTLSLPLEDAKREYQIYLSAMKEKDLSAHKQYEVLKEAYYNLSQGRGIIDIYEVLKAGGLNEETLLPRLAVCVADAKKCRFFKHRYHNDRPRFMSAERGSTWYSRVKDVQLPETVYDSKTWKDTINVTTPVPMIPPQHLPKGRLGRYYLLWEVEAWKPEPPRDPVLMRRLNDNLFVVLAKWNLTPLERAVLKGFL